jgi:ribonuclease T2
VASLGGATEAAASCFVDQSRSPHYTLALTVVATYCRANRADAACKTFPKASAIQLHGLWVDYRLGPDPKYPVASCTDPGCAALDHSGVNFCDALPAVPGLYQSAIWRKLKGYFAGGERCLERYEWIKHGTCTPMDVAHWGGWALDQTVEIAAKLGLPTDTPISRQRFDDAIDQNLPAFSGAFHLRCAGTALSDLYIDFVWGASPGAVIKTAARRNDYRRCPDVFVIPSRP